MYCEVIFYVSLLFSSVIVKTEGELPDMESICDAGLFSLPTSTIDELERVIIHKYFSRFLDPKMIKWARKS